MVGIHQIIIGKFELRMAVLLREVFDVPHSLYEPPLLASETEYTTKAEFITQPGTIRLITLVAVRTMPPNVGGYRIGIRAGSSFHSPSHVPLRFHSSHSRIS